MGSWSVCEKDGRRGVPAPWCYRASCRTKNYGVLEHAVAEHLAGF